MLFGNDERRISRREDGRAAQRTRLFRERIRIVASVVYSFPNVFSVPGEAEQGVSAIQQFRKRAMDTLLRFSRAPICGIPGIHGFRVIHGIGDAAPSPFSFIFNYLPMAGVSLSLDREKGTRSRESVQRGKGGMK